MSVTPTGSISTVIDTLRQMLAASANFQALLQVPDAATALLSIYPHGYPDDMPRPAAFVGIDEWKPKLVGSGLRDYWMPEGRLFLWIERDAQKQGSLSGVTSTSVVTDAALIGYPDNYFAGMSIHLTGANPIDATDHVISASAKASGQLTLTTPFTGLPQVGNTYFIYAPQPDQAFTPFFNTIGPILDDVLALSGAGGYLALRNPHIPEFGRPQRDHKVSVDYVMGKLSFDFGI